LFHKNINGFFELLFMLTEMDIQLPNHIAYRQKRMSLGVQPSKELVGCGFMKKELGSDHQDYRNGCWSISYVICGEGIYVLNGVEHPVGPGTIFQRRPEETHSTRVTQAPPWVECFIDFGPKMHEALEAMGLCRPGCPVNSIGLSQTLVDEFAILAEFIQSKGESEWIECTRRAFDLTLKLLGTAIQPKSHQDQEMVQKAQHDLAQHLELRFDLKRWCQKRQWDYDKFRRLFKEATGWSPSQYRIRKRMDQACLMMELNPNQNLNYFSEKLGYPSIYEFASQFKSMVGMPPGQFKKRFKHS
jgi:AraC family transcriptional regulator of arabinose operon